MKQLIIIVAIMLVSVGGINNAQAFSKKKIVVAPVVVPVVAPVATENVKAATSPVVVAKEPLQALKTAPVTTFTKKKVVAKHTIKKTIAKKKRIKRKLVKKKTHRIRVSKSDRIKISGFIEHLRKL